MDAYDHMVAYLTERPERIYSAWSNTSNHPAGGLFEFAAPDKAGEINAERWRDCGCLTMIRSQRTSASKAWTDELTAAIRNDTRIPDDPLCISVESLPVFAGWQRRPNIILNRTPPVWNGPPCAKPEVEMAPAEVEQLA